MTFDDSSIDLVCLDKDKVDEVEEPSKKVRRRSVTEKVPSPHRWTSNNFPVPQLSTRMLTLLESPEDFFRDLKKFVHEIGDHFINVVKQSYANVYHIYVEALMRHYPQIGDCATLARKGKMISDGLQQNAVDINENTEEVSLKMNKEFGVSNL